MRILWTLAFTALATPSFAAQCGNDSSGFGAWKAAFAQEAAAAGVGPAGLQALANAQYSQSTINADRNQTGVRYELDDFIRIRLGSLDSFAAQMRRERDRNANFYASLERAYGMPRPPPRSRRRMSWPSARSSSVSSATF